MADVVGTGALAHSQQTSGNVRLAYDITPQVQATYSFGIWNNVQTSNPQTYLTSTVNGAADLRRRSGFASNKYIWDQTHMSNAISLKSDTKGTYDFDLSASSYNYLQDIMYNPYTVYVRRASGYSQNGKVTRNDGTNWQNVDAKGIWRPYGYDGPQEITFGIHGDRYELENPVYVSSVWNATPSTGTGQLYSDGVGETRTGALWVQDAWKIAPKLKLTLGGRQETWRALDGFNVNTIARMAPAASLRRYPPYQSAGTQLDQFLAKSVAVLGSQQGMERHGQFRRGLSLSYRHRTLPEHHCRRRRDLRQSEPDAGAGPERRVRRRAPMDRWPGQADVVRRTRQQRDHFANQHCTLPATAQVPATTFGNVDAIRMQGVELAAEKDNVADQRSASCSAA